MTYRRQPIVPGQIYHIFNRSIAGEPIFLDVKDYSRFLKTTDFYRFSSPPLRFSFFDRLPIIERDNFLKNLKERGQKLVSIYAFCLMPNHFHFLTKELVDEGIKRFVSNLQNSYAKYFNTKRKRQGSLFQEMFKAVLIETEEQFLHVARYIHLNPYSSFLVRTISQLENYQWSSFGDYLGKTHFEFLDKDFLNGFYSSSESLRSFTLDQKDYQRRLEKIKHLVCE
jgi:putative transposase